jgi:hypothetical protein
VISGEFDIMEKKSFFVQIFLYIGRNMEVIEKSIFRSKFRALIIVNKLYYSTRHAPKPKLVLKFWFWCMPILNGNPMK